MGIHKYDQRYEASKRRVQKAVISERNKELIMQMNDALVLDGLSKPRLMKYLEVLKLFAERLNKDFDKATEEDLKKVVSVIQQANYSPWTKQTYKVIIRRFYKWFHKSEDFPPIVKWINIRMSKSERRLPSEGDLLTEKDVEKLLDAAEHPRDKAFISILWESGARVGEIGNLKIKNVSFDKYGTVITVSGKTGSRKIRLITTTPYLSTWLNNHPFRKDPDFPLWINLAGKNYHKEIGYTNIRELLRNLFNKAEIRKRFNPHLFRHSRATFMANHLTEFQMNQYFGWIQGSDMPATYVHMSGKNVDNAILAMNGIQPEEKKDDVRIRPLVCPRCDTINGHDNRFCLKCGGILDLRHAMEVEEEQRKEIKERSGADKVMNLLLKDRDVRKLLQEKLGGLGGASLSF